MIHRLLRKHKQKMLEDELVKSRRKININEEKTNKKIIIGKEFDNIANLNFNNITYYKCLPIPLLFWKYL